MARSFFADYNPIARLALGYRASKPLLVALHYDLFTRIEEGMDTAVALAGTARLDPEAVRRLLDALAALDCLAKDGRRYRNTREGRRLLVASSPESIGHSLRYQEQTWDAWSDLRRVVKSGKPRRRLLDWIGRDAFTEDYIRAMGDVTRRPAVELAARLGLSGVRRTLDVGCGAGNFSAAFVQAQPALEATLFDLPRTIPLIRRLLRHEPGFERMRFVSGDFRRDGFGREEYDLVLISGVTRVENDATNAAMARKAFRALKPGGRLVVHDFVIDEDRRGPSFAALLDLHLLVFTGRGRVYSVGEYSRLMREAGFSRVRSFPVAKESLHPTTAVVGVK